MDGEQPPGGARIRIDESAESTDPTLPAFLARPDGSPAYYGFPVLEHIEVDGFKLGAITDYVGAEVGDGFVVAPDGSRAGLIWQVFEEEMFIETMAPDAMRWGVWEVSFPAIMKDEHDVRRNFARLVPTLRDRWTAWAKGRQSS